MWYSFNLPEQLKPMDLRPAGGKKFVFLAVLSQKSRTLGDGSKVGQVGF